MEKRNTNTMGVERIWMLKTFRVLLLKEDESSGIESVIAHLQLALVAAKEQGCEDVTVYPDYEERDEECGESRRMIEIRGWRLENDIEYKERLKSILWACKRNKEVWEQRQKYFESDCHTKRVTELENAIEILRHGPTK